MKMNGLLYFVILFFATIIAGILIAFLSIVIRYAKDRKKRAFIARIRKHFLKNNPKLDPEEFKLRLLRIKERSGCCRAIMWSRISPSLPERHYCDKCGKENIKTARGYATKERQ